MWPAFYLWLKLKFYAVISKIANFCIKQTHLLIFEGMLVSLISLTVCMHGADKCIYALTYLFENRNQSVSKR